MMMVVLVCFGAAIADGSVFEALNWKTVVVGMAILLVVRPSPASSG